MLFNVFSPTQMAAANKKLGSFVNKRLEGERINKIHTMYIMALNTKGSLSMKELSEFLCFDKSNTTRIMAELEGKGLVVVVEGENNGKNRKYSLTDNGTRLAHKIDAIMDEWFGRVFEGVSLQEVEQFKATFDKFIYNINRIGD